MSKAIFPISPNNILLRTENMVRLLSLVTRKYDEVFFVFFDQLQMYNKAVAISNIGELESLISKLDNMKTAVHQRRNWVRKMKAKATGPIVEAEWQVIGIEHIADDKVHLIFRNLLISFETLQNFRTDVENAALQFWARRNEEITDLKLRLSVLYILEEIALSLRIRVFAGIEDEYYSGKYLLPLLKIYSSSYGIDPVSLAGYYGPGAPYRFFSISRNARQVEWTLLQDSHCGRNEGKHSL